MLPTPTAFPQTGSFALLRVVDHRPDGTRAGTRQRRVRIQQHNADGSILVTCPEQRVTVGYRPVTLPAIQKTVRRADLRRVPKLYPDTSDAIIVHGPQRCGKTRNRVAIARHFDLTPDKVIDDWMPGKPVRPGYLHFTYEAPPLAQTFGALVVDFAAIPLGQPA